LCRLAVTALEWARQTHKGVFLCVGAAGGQENARRSRVDE